MKLIYSFCRLRYRPDNHHELGLQRPPESHAEVHVRQVSAESLDTEGNESLTCSVPEKRIDELKGEYIKDREQRKIEALANYIQALQ